MMNQPTRKTHTHTHTQALLSYRLADHLPQTFNGEPDAALLLQTRAMAGYSVDVGRNIQVR